MTPSEGVPPSSQPARISGSSDVPGQASPLSAFTLDFAKAMLRTGYYAPDHPEAQQSRAGLYEEFRGLLGDRSGITYLVGMDGERRTVMVDGYEAGPLALDKVMIRGMAELFVPKLLEFFDRRHLLSFSLRTGIQTEEFNAFVILMSEPPRGDHASEEREHLTQAFLDRNILNVSTLFEADVVGRERKLPWRVELALSRLGRDLRMLPMYEHASKEKIQETKIQIIDDVIRPMRTPKLLTDLLVNCDVLAEDIAVLEESQIEHEIIAQIPADLLLATAQLLVEDLQRLEAVGDQSADLVARHRVVIRDTLSALVRQDAEVGGELLDAVVSREILTVEDLPKSLQKRLKQQRVLQRFLSESDRFIAAFGHLRADTHGQQLAAVARLVFPELLRRGHYTEAARTLEAFESGVHEPDTAATVRGLTATLHQSLAAEHQVRHMLESLADVDLDKPGRDALVTLLSDGGTVAIEGLRDVYATTTSVPIRTTAFETMLRIGTPALGPFLVTLADVEHEWHAIHHVLVALAGQSDPNLAEPIVRFLKHENAHVRQAALTRIFELLGPDAENRLLVALDDPDPATRHAAVAHLGQLGSHHARALTFYADALHPEDATLEHEEVLVEVCRALAGVGDAPFPGGSRAEELLLRALQREGRKRMSGIFHKRPALHSERIRVAICEALGMVGSTATADTLRDLAAAESGEPG